MFFKVALLCCAQLLLVNLSAAQYIGSGYGFGAGGCCGAAVAPINAGCAPITSSGGGFIVSSSSPINPSGLYVLSENTIEGNLGVNGQIPFLGAVSLEGDVPSQGNTAVQYNCGGCDIGITAENRNAAPVGPCCGAGAGAGLAGPGIGFGVPGAGLGYSGAGAGFGFGAAGAGLGYGGSGTGLGYGAGGAGLGYGAADAGLGYGAAGTGLGYGGLGSGYGTGYGAGYGYGLGSAIY